MIKVYHRKNTRFDDDVEFFEIQDYTLVATVDAKQLGLAFRLTNTIDSYWWENEGVTAHVTETRSTSVGDVLEFEGKFNLVMMFGFKFLPVRTLSNESMAVLQQSLKNL